ncbi:MAG: Glu-tRNA(Gln) amidotransferase subunit GatD [Methanobacteriota archaeon]|nr:MAG: Glu-tRNA(Gln) amidotransferase subunit GatD [Euryarchaeota archaeon]
MRYPGRLGQSLEEAEIDVGDEIEVSKDGETYRGVLMPHHDFSDPSIVTLKLASGYNIGLELGKDSKVRRVSEKQTKDAVERTMPVDPSKKKVAFLGTGGTIASYVDYRTGAVHPAKSAEELVFSVPELMDICDVKARVLYSIYSENMDVSHWQELARAAAEELNSGASGVIIPHGTDTMGFTSAALSFMLRALTGPVVCVGSQRSSDRPSSDATMNLLAAARLCVDADLGEVVVVMHGDISDDHCHAHRGTKVRKMHSSRRDAFRSVNIEPLARIEGRKIAFAGEHTKRSQGSVEVLDKMNKRVSMLQFYPGFEPEHFDMIAGNVRGIVIAGTGLGHVSDRLVESIDKAVRDGVFVAVTTQCLHGAVNLNVYSTGRDMISAGAVPLEDMLPETAFVKLMWTLGQTEDPEEAKKIMLSNIAGEIASRRSV